MISICPTVLEIPAFFPNCQKFDFCDQMGQVAKCLEVTLMPSEEKVIVLEVTLMPSEEKVSVLKI